MPEDEIAQRELAALTRRFEEHEERNAREFGIVKSDLTALRLQVGNLDQKVDGLSQRLDDFITQQQRTNATLVDLMTRIVGQRPE